MPRFVADPNYKSRKIQDFSRMMMMFQQQKDRRESKEYERDQATMDQIMRAAAQGYSSPKAQAFIDQMQEKYGDQGAMWGELYKAATETGQGVKDARRMAQGLYMRGGNGSAGPQMKTIGQATGAAPAPAAAPGMAQGGPPQLSLAQAQQMGLDVNDPRYFGYQRQLGPADLPQSLRAPFVPEMTPEAMQAWRYSQNLEMTPEEKQQFEQQERLYGIKEKEAATKRMEQERLARTGGSSGGQKGEKRKPWTDQRAMQIRQEIMDDNRYGSGAGSDGEKRKIPGFNEAKKMAAEEADGVFSQYFGEIKGDNAKILRREYDKLLDAGRSPEEASLLISQEIARQLSGSNGARSGG